MNVESIQNSTYLRKTNWLAIVSLILGILSVSPHIFFLLLIIIPSYINSVFSQLSNGITAVVSTYLYFGSLFFGLASVITGSIAFIKLIDKGNVNGSESLGVITGISFGIIGVLFGLFLIISDMLSSSCQCGV